MTTGNSSQLFGGNRYVTNPKHLPIRSILKNALEIKTGVSSQSLSSTTAFFTALALEGAASAITVADTYVTVLDVAGGGFLYDAIFPTHSAAYRPTGRFTVDGVVYTISPTADQTALWRFVIGALTLGTSVSGVTVAAVAGDTLTPNGAFDAGFNRAKIGGVRQYGGSAADILGVPSESAIMDYGMPMLRFESSLKVEMKCNLLSADSIEKQCGVTYRMDL